MAVAAAGLLIVALGVSARLNDQQPLSSPATPSDEPTPLPKVVADAPAPAATASRQTGATRPPSAPAAATRLTALSVEHRHRIGGCRGVLTVSRTGIAFAPDPASSRAGDAFALRYDEFFHELDDDGDMIIRSSARTYRFKALVSGGSNGGDQVQQLLASMAKLR